MCTGYFNNGSKPLEIQQRDPYQSEIDFFNQSNVPGYASPDNKVVISPKDLPGVNKDAVRQNEAMRIYIREKQPKLPDITPEQSKFLEGTSYGKAPDYERRATLLGRIASGDPSAGKPTKEQMDFVQSSKGKFILR